MRILLAFLLSAALALPAGAAGKGAPMVPQAPFLKIAASWSGEASADELAALPQWRPQLRGGCLGDEAAFAAFWQVFKPGAIAPRVDFGRNMAVFVTRDSAYAQLAIVKVTLKDEAAEVVASGHRSGPARAERMSVAVAVIPRAGVRFLRVDGEQAPVEP
jgi:hypothetical protein